MAEFLWGGGDRPRPEDFAPRGVLWWSQYSATLRVTAAAKRELYESSRDIAALLPDPQNWGTRPSPFRGLVVGAVQSGKTASMMGLAAVALDQGYRVVVVMSGSKDDLRLQTASRFNKQLLRRSEVIPNSGGRRTLRLEESAGAMAAFCLPYYRDAHEYAHFHLSLQRVLGEGQPVVLVIKKHITSLEDCRRKLELAYSRFGVGALPTLVLDDECDEASVDAKETAVPSAIAGLWRRRGEVPRVAYVGYTATSAANLLQKQDNDLFPADFVYLLRHPSSEDSATSFAEPVPDAWHSGGHTFYEAFGVRAGPSENFLIAPTVSLQDALAPVSANPSLRNAVRAFIVGGAYRLALSEWNLTVPSLFPTPHCMLVQTSPSVADHKTWLKGIAAMFGTGFIIAAGSHQWSVDEVLEDLRLNESEWKQWYDEFSVSRARILEERPRIGGGGIPTWNRVRDEISPFVSLVKIKAVNSDEQVGSDLDFVSHVSGDGSPQPPNDLFVVVVGGAKLSRGLTIEGLCISYFTRWTANPTEDTVLQLSRWYGYRGPHLEFCRLVTTPSIHGELESMNENDTDLRSQLATLMQLRKSPADAAIVISSNPRALPTGKRGEGKLCDLAYSPFATVFRHVECVNADLQRSNESIAKSLVEQIRGRDPEVVRARSGVDQGFLSRGWSAAEVAAELEALTYSDHNPSSAANPARDFYRRPDLSREVVSGLDLATDPYQVAAYLRQWAAEGGAPTFSVGVSFGEMASNIDPFDFPLTNREVTDQGELVGGWTGPRPGWQGDMLFDDPTLATLVPGTTARREGAPGLLLLYVIHKDSVGRHGRGQPRVCHTPAFGIAIPGGGPMWRRVTVDRRRVVVE